MTTRVLVDANVLHSRTLRDWLFLLRNATGGGMFTVTATEDILTEVVASYRRRYPAATGAQTRNLRVNLEQQLDDLFSAYEPAEHASNGDPRDAHVRAAATASGVSMLLSDDKNVVADRDDPSLGYEVITSDEFFVLVDDSAAKHVRQVARDQYAYWANRVEFVDLPGHLRDAGCDVFAARVDEHVKANLKRKK